LIALKKWVILTYITLFLSACATLQKQGSDEYLYVKNLAQQGQPHYQYLLGLIHLGEYEQVEANAGLLSEKQAKKWFIKAANQGDEDAQNKLGFITTGKESVQATIHSKQRGDCHPGASRCRHTKI